jgi:agmatinase
MTSIALLGVPNDDNSSATKGAAQAPALIRREFHNDAYSLWSETGVDLGAAGRVIDHGDVRFDEGVDAWDAIEHTASRVLTTGTPLVCLGGDHAITHPILRAVRKHHARLTILHIDAHADIYDAYQGNRRSHASPFARIMEENLCDRLIQVGLRTVNDEHRAQFARFGVETVEARHCRDGLRFDYATPVYVSIDIDALDPAHAPGVSHREPGGLTVRQVIDLVQAIDAPIVGADIVEFNPLCDVDGQTATVAAKLLKEVAGMMVRTHEK